jgi:hypothetical protein
LALSILAPRMWLPVLDRIASLTYYSVRVLVCQEWMALWNCLEE